MIDITEVKVFPIKKENLKNGVQAFAQITINNAICIKNLRVIQGKGLFVAFPQTKRKNEDKYDDIVFPITKEAREVVMRAVLDKFAETMEGVDFDNQDQVQAPWPESSSSEESLPF